jgi:hypothetical protein
MLVFLILRRVSFEFRTKATGWHRELWNRMFFVGSLGVAGAVIADLPLSFPISFGLDTQERREKLCPTPTDRIFKRITCCGRTQRGIGLAGAGSDSGRERWRGAANCGQAR